VQVAYDDFERPSDPHGDAASSIGKPSLTAIVAYLRPVQRAPLLASLANLGVFVTEEPGKPSSDGPRGDIGIVCGFAGDEGTRAAIRALQARCRSVICLTRNDDDSDTDTPRDTIPEDAFLANPSVALAEASRLARRERGDAAPRLIDLLGFEAEGKKLARSGVTVGLAAAESALLMELVKSWGVPVASERLLTTIGGEPEQRTHYLRLLIHRLRRKLARLGVDPGVVATVRGVGYVLVQQPDRT
jgi:DNA-binding response OmpR family regulator